MPWKTLTKYGSPEIFNTDQGCQFTSIKFTAVLKTHGVKISMDGNGRWRDNVSSSSGCGSVRGGLSARLRHRQ
jgi:transposase InsO family protein